jgi:hypothetical protein
VRFGRDLDTAARPRDAPDARRELDATGPVRQAVLQLRENGIVAGRAAVLPEVARGLRVGGDHPGAHVVQVGRVVALHDHAHQLALGIAELPPLQEARDRLVRRSAAGRLQDLSETLPDVDHGLRRGAGAHSLLGHVREVHGAAAESERGRGASVHELGSELDR